jgi:hypothetical protein
MTHVAPSRRAPVTVQTAGNTVVLSLADHLDENAGEALVAAACAALDARPDRIDIDLRALASWTLEGARSLVRCREVCTDLLGGLHYRTGRGPGREALLAAYS